MGLKLMLKSVWTFIYPYVGSILTVGTGIWGVSMWRGWLHYKKELKINHSKELVKNFQNQKVTLDLVKDSLKLKVKSYPEEINSHLEDDVYKDLKKIIKRRNDYIKLHNEELNVFYSDLNVDIIKYINQKNFIEFDNSRSSEGQETFFNKDTIEVEIIKAIFNNYNTLYPISFRIELHDNYYYLYCTINNNIWFMCDDKEKLNEIEKLIIITFNNAIQRKLWLLLGYYGEIEALQSTINTKLKQTSLLKGKCIKCPKENTFFQYLWQRIDKSLQ